MAVVLNASGVNRVRFTVINNMKSLFHPQREIHYIGGTDILPPPLEPEEEAYVLSQLDTKRSEEAKALLQDDDKVSYTLALDRIANGT